jgi:hypothetical protein
LAQLSVVDYSARANVPDGQLAADIAAAGVTGVMRYAVRDWRGITYGEKVALEAHGLNIGLVHEGVEDRLLSGYAGGVADAAYALDVALALGFEKKSTPFYFASDWDAQDWELDEIDDYLNGAASVVGREMTGIYGGLRVVTHCREAGTAARTWQTSAWSWVDGVLTWHPQNNLEQWGYNHWIGGTNVDDCTGKAADWGQAGIVTPTPAPPYASVAVAPDFFAQLEQPVPEVLIWKWDGQNLHLQPFRRNGRMRRGSNEYPEPVVGKAHAGIFLPEGRRVAFERWTKVKEVLPSGKTRQRVWLQTRAGTWVPGDAVNPKAEFGAWTAGR